MKIPNYRLFAAIPVNKELYSFSNVCFIGDAAEIALIFYILV
jgi:hypothetical protein